MKGRRRGKKERGREREGEGEGVVCNRWTGLLDWNTRMDYWNNL